LYLRKFVEGFEVLKRAVELNCKYRKEVKVAALLVEGSSYHRYDCIVMMSSDDIKAPKKVRLCGGSAPLQHPAMEGSGMLIVPADGSSACLMSNMPGLWKCEEGIQQSSLRNA
jgi:hypothetical protein